MSKVLMVHMDHPAKKLTQYISYTEKRKISSLYKPQVETEFGGGWVPGEATVEINRYGGSNR